MSRAEPSQMFNFDERSSVRLRLVLTCCVGLSPKLLTLISVGGHKVSPSSKLYFVFTFFKRCPELHALKPWPDLLTEPSLNRPFPVF